MFDDISRWPKGSLMYEVNETSSMRWDDYDPFAEQGYDIGYDWYTYSYLVVSDKQDDKAYLDETNENCKKPDSDDTFKDGMSECQENMKAIKSQLDQILELLRHQPKRQNPVDECVKPDVVEVEKKAPNTIMEHGSLSINFQPQIEARKLSEDMHIIEEIRDDDKGIVEKLSHDLKIVEEIPHHEPIKTSINEEIFNGKKRTQQELSF